MKRFAFPRGRCVACPGRGEWRAGGLVCCRPHAAEMEVVRRLMTAIHQDVDFPPAVREPSPSPMLTRVFRGGGR